MVGERGDAIALPYAHMAENTHANNTVTSTLDSLPRELQEVALDYADVYDLGGAAVACRDLREVVEDVLPHRARESRCARVAAGRRTVVVAHDGTLGPAARTRRGAASWARAPSSACTGPRACPRGPAVHLRGGARSTAFAGGVGRGLQLRPRRLRPARPRRPGVVGDAAARRRARGRFVVAVSCGQQHSLALTDAAPYAFGSGFGKTGLGDQRSRSLPRRVAGIPEPVAVLTAARTTPSATASGAVYAGSNVHLQLGLPERGDAYAPRRVDALDGRVVQLSGGEHHSLAVDAAGACYSWGAGEAERTSVMVGGFLGHRSLDDAARPRRVEGLAGVRIVASSAGRSTRSC
ncbi:GTPase [Aureococcus anophagefferens]|nr:GTPase [Aureococcus anophagefferens]